jgi:lipoprotein-releasing system ATP-binding protein
MLVAKSITKSYGDTQVLQNIDLVIADQEIVSIMGASGAGKSTLMHILATLDKPSTGQLHFNNIDLLKLNQTQLADFRNKSIGFVFQFHNLLPELTAFENICLPGYIGNFDKKLVHKKAENLLERLSLTHRTHYRPADLSGGEKQRVAIARALINEPKIIFADEPCGNLDSENTKNMYHLLLSLQKEFGKILIVSTHNPDFAKMAHRNIIMKDGRIVQEKNINSASVPQLTDT